MKSFQTKLLACALALGQIIQASTSFAQPANEVKCMDNFDFDNKGNSKVNAYLLMMINHFMCPHFTINKPEDDPAVTALHLNPQRFKDAFINRVGHFFSQPAKLNLALNQKNIVSKTPVTKVSNNIEKDVEFDFVAMSNNIGVDPEAMVISTPKYIIVAFRGTDRVANRDPLVGKAIYDWGEWIQTDAYATKTSPPSEFGFTRGKVHFGFNTAVMFKPGSVSFLDSLTNVLRRRGVENKKLWLTGHSLGSAQATLTAAYLKKGKNINPFCIYLYASPHVGDSDFTNQLNNLFPGTTLQRFDFIDDPITVLPPYFMGYQRAGIRNRYSKETGNGNYFFNTDENSGEKLNAFFCLHHTNWYARAAYFELVDHNPAMASKVPSAPAKPQSFCSFIDDLIVGGEQSLGASLVGGSEHIEEGNYYIMNGKSLKYLAVPSGVTDQNGSVVEVDKPSGTNAQWKVRKIPGALVGGYTIQLVKDSKYLDAELFNVNNDGCKVQLWARSISPDRRNQEWYVERLNNGRFRIKNVMNTSKLLHVSSSSAGTNGANVTLNKNLNQRNQEWFFVKVQ